METVPCDLCGCQESTVVVRQTDRLHRTTNELFSIVCCRNCGLSFTNPRPEMSEIGRYYSSEYAFHGQISLRRKWLDLILDKWANSRFAIIAGIVPQVGRRLAARLRPPVPDPVLAYFQAGGQGPFLDIGCGSGVRAHYWGYESSLRTCSRFAQVAGVEVSAAARATLVESGIRCWADLPSVPGDERFGLIRMNWSLEHVHAPSAYFAFMSEHLLPGGQVVIAVPNIAGNIYRLAPDCVELPIHLYHFRAQDIAAYGERHGLRVVRAVTFSYPGMYFAAAQAGLLPAGFNVFSGIGAARSLNRCLSVMDAEGWGNDMLLVLEKSSGQEAVGGAH